GEGHSHHQRPTAGATVWPVPVAYVPPPAPIAVKPANAATVIGLPPITEPPPIAPGPAPAPAPAGRWGEFEELGLTAPPQPAQKLSRLVVAVYRVLGFSILTIIVPVLVRYNPMSAIYFFFRSLILPLALNPNDP